jgi:hypothetical protein
MKLLFTFCVATSSLAGFGCSDDGDNAGLGGPNKCGQVQPCGGDVVGDWTIAGACVDPDAITNDDIESVKTLCPTLTYKTSYKASGSASFTSTNYIYDIQQTVTAIIDVPASCLKNFNLTCADVDMLLEQQVGSGADAPTVNCSGSGGCTCILSAPANIAESGTYTTDGNSLYTTPTGSDAAEATPFCVDGSTLHVIQMNDEGSDVVSDIIGKK